MSCRNAGLDLVRIVFLSPSAANGGAETVLLQLIESLGRSRPDWELHLIAAEDGPLVRLACDRHISNEILAFPSALRSLGEQSGDLWCLARGFIAALGYRRKLRRRLRELQPTVVHSNGIKMHLVAALAQKASAQRYRLVW